MLASTAFVLVSALPAAQPAHAQDATWLANPGTADLNTGSNWDTGSVPTGTATFGTSATTALTLNTNVTFGGWTFNAGASNYTFTATYPAWLQFVGAGIVVNGGSAAITNSHVLLFYNASTAGSATITNHGNAYFYDSSTAGSAAITNTYSLVFGSSSTAGSATIINNYGLSFLDTATAGSATITSSSSGVTSFGGTSTAGSADITNNGSMYFDGSSTAGSATITNNSGGLLTFYATSTADSATIANNHGGTLNFNNNSTAGNAGITNAGTLNFNNTSTAGSAVIANSGILNFNNNSTAGGAAITNNSGGGMYFYNASTAGSATITNNYGLGFYGTSTAGSATITSIGTLGFNNASSAGSADITNNGVMGFGSTSTAGNATIINNDNLSFWETSTADNATITNNGALQFFETSTGGAARIINGAGATIDLSVLSATGATAGSIEGAGTIALGSKNLQVGGNDLSTTFSGVLQDGGSFGSTGGSLTKTGAGTLTLSGTNIYTGATTVNGGTLAVNSTLTATSGITVNNGGVLGGIGTVGNTTIASGGTLAPGNSIGTLTVNGNLTFNAGGFYTVEVSPTAADRTNVTGTATLTGATVQAVALPGRFRQQTYTILNATGGFGGTQFAGLTSSSFAPGARNPHLTYDANNVYLVLDPGTIQLPSGASGHQVNVAGGINKAVESGATPPAAFDVLLNMTGAQLGNALNQVSGQPATGGATSGMQMMNSFLTLLLNPFGGAPDSNPGTLGFARGFGAGEQPLSPQAAAAYAAVTPRDAGANLLDRRWGLWGQGYGGYNRTSGDAALGTSDTTARSFGFAGGADYRVAANTLIGFALAGGSMNWGLAQGLGGGKSDVFQIGGYGSHSFGAAYVSGALSYAWHGMSTDRTVTIADTDKLAASFNAQSFGGRVEAGYRVVTPWLGITPYAALQVQNFRTPSYSESAASGSNAFALAYDARSTTATRTELGAWFDKLIALDRGNAIALRTRAAWANDHSSNPALGAVFQTLPGSTFTVGGAQAAANSALLSGGAELRLANRWSIGARFDGEFARGSQTYAGNGAVRYAW
ncbi:MAG TPA: autotransporter domain-containing protein [Xanthobacteraceae bacterium]|nr:autotransporter domain-containing protein [Xanthobacteraceae bacterium]